jgi:hypothetical protein
LTEIYVSKLHTHPLWSIFLTTHPSNRSEELIAGVDWGTDSKWRAYPLQGFSFTAHLFSVWPIRINSHSNWMK